MKVSFGWLSEYVDIDVQPSKLADMLSMSGTKVEEIVPPSTDVKGVVVAEVVDISEHPNADSLILVDVSTGGGDAERVVCGVRNFEAGDRVPFARVGARLPGMEITERTIRGQVSAGMLCSPRELGVSRDHTGILVLPAEAPLGEDVVETIGLDDTILDLEITPNRPDCMGHVGVAREVAALLKTELRMPDPRSPPAGGDARITVQIEDPAGCPRYVARSIEGVTVGAAPLWVQARLLGCGVRPISNVVDVTNYVLLELGHPLHAFDAAKVAARTIVVRRATAGERLTTLDGRERSLDGADLLIADPERALALAGVMGGEDSEVSDSTTDVILESAYFHPASIAFSSRRHQLRTEASARFERGADPEMAPVAAARAAGLLAEMAGGTASTEVVDAYPAPVRRPVVAVRPARTTHVLGYEIDTAGQAAHLRSAGFATNRSDDELIEVSVPSWRPDIGREEDLIEEIARLAGFDRLPATLPPGRAGFLEPAQAAERRLRRVLAGFGLYEAWTSSFGAPSDLDALGLGPDHPARSTVMLENPTSEAEPALRTTVLPGLLRSAARNFSSHRARGAALFEIAHVYEPSGEELPNEPLVLGAVFAGLRDGVTWRHGDRPWDFFAAKGIIEAAFAAMGMQAPALSAVRGMPFHPTRAAAVAWRRTTIGALGEIHPEVCRRFDLPEGAVVAEIGLDRPFGSLPGRARVRSLDRYPAVTLDVAVVVDEGVPAGRVQEVIRRAGRPEVRAVSLFDVYRGDQIDDTKKSLAFALEMRADDRTMTDEEANAVLERVLTVVRESTGAELRR